MNIKKLVIGGGGHGLYNIYGVLKNMIEKKYINYDNINQIYSVSAGAICGTIIALKINLNILDDYIIKRPWEKVFNKKPSDILINIFNEKGIYDENFFKEIMKPLLKVKNFDENITLKELYNETKIELIMFTVNLNSELPEKIKLSHITYPDLSLCKALYMSACVPLIFKPVIDNNNCYIDGGFIDNFPLGELLNDNRDNKNIENEILAIKVIQKEKINTPLTNDSNIINYIQLLISSLRLLSQKESEEFLIKNMIICKIDNSIFNINTLSELFNNENFRNQLVLDGINESDQFITEFKNSFNVS
tara:strand:- start:432 stop:1346 length:915 start_codon:yes stop_codon:yes gene_type:complete